MKHALIVACAFTATLAFAADEDKDINKYLVDINGGAISAIGLIKGDQSAITPIETSQDLVMALQPLTSGDKQKDSFGIAVTPAKTSIVPMAGRTYLGSPYARLLGNLTLSYAQNRADFAGKNYQRQAYSVDTVYFFDLEDDPVYMASDAFKTCADRTGAENANAVVEINQRRRDGVITADQAQKALEALTTARATQLFACMDEGIATAQKRRWNSGRMSVSYGEGRITSDDGAQTYSLGKGYNVNVQIGAGDRGLFSLSLRQARRGVDTDSLGSGTPLFVSSRLVAARFTYGDQDDSALRVIAEVSNAKSDAAGVFKGAFMHAVGVDKKIASGMWLEFKIGRKRSTDNGKEQTSALMSVNVVPSLLAFKK